MTRKKFPMGSWKVLINEFVSNSAVSRVEYRTDEAGVDDGGREHQQKCKFTGRDSVAPRTLACIPIRAAASRASKIHRDGGASIGTGPGAS